MQVNRYVHPSLIIPATLPQPELKRMLELNSDEMYDSSIYQFVRDFDHFVTHKLASLDRPTRFKQRTAAAGTTSDSDSEAEDCKAAEMFFLDIKALRQIAIDALKNYLQTITKIQDNYNIERTLLMKKLLQQELEIK